LWDARSENNVITILGGYIYSLWDLEYVDNGNTYDSWLYELKDSNGTIINSFDPYDPNNRYATNWELEDGMTIIWNYVLGIPVQTK
jgi:hypothetical protein